MNLHWLWALFLLIAFVAATPANKQEPTLIKTEFLLRQWSRVNSEKGLLEPKIEENSINLPEWTPNTEKAQEKNPGYQKNKRAEQTESKHLRFHSRVRKIPKSHQMNMNQFIKRNGEDRILTDPDTHEVIICKEVPYNLCFKVSEDGSLLPLNNNEEPRPIRLLRVYRR